MNPWQQRVVDEAKELTEKIDKLASFLRSPNSQVLMSDERVMYGIQLNAMTIYLGILELRISKFN